MRLASEQVVTIHNKTTSKDTSRQAAAATDAEPERHTIDDCSSKRTAVVPTFHLPDADMRALSAEELSLIMSAPALHVCAERIVYGILRAEHSSAAIAATNPNHQPLHLIQSYFDLTQGQNNHPKPA